MYLFKEEFYIIRSIWQTYKRNSHLLRKMEGTIDNDPIFHAISPKQHFLTQSYLK